ncbi:hypothetical protein BH10ACT9_BH10ACT9_35490 [soil metagenome]
MTVHELSTYVGYNPDTKTIHVDDQVTITIEDGDDGRYLVIRHTYEGQATAILLDLLTP